MRAEAPFVADRGPPAWFWAVSNSAGAVTAAPKLVVRGADFLKPVTLRARVVFWLMGVSILSRFGEVAT